MPRDIQQNIERRHVSRELNHMRSHSTELSGSSNANVRNSERKLVQLRDERVQERVPVDRLSRARSNCNDNLADIACPDTRS